MSTAAMGAMPAEKVGVASGVLAMDRVMAGAVALASVGAVFHALQSGGSSFSEALAASTWVPVALCAGGAALTWGFRPRPQAAQAQTRRSPETPQRWCFTTTATTAASTSERPTACLSGS